MSCLSCLYRRSRLAPLLARTIAGIISDVEQLAQRLQSSERLLRQEVDQYSKDPSAGASQGLCPVKVSCCKKGGRAAGRQAGVAAYSPVHAVHGVFWPAPPPAEL